MIKGKTKSGFEYEFDEKNIDDMRFIELLSSVEEHVGNAVKAIEWMLGKDQKNALYEHIAEQNDGRVRIEAFGEIFNEIIEDAAERSNEVKN